MALLAALTLAFLPAATAAQDLDARALRTLHLDLLGRPPLPEEAAAGIGRTRELLVDALIAAPEFWERWYAEQQYYFLLVNNFAPRGERHVTIPAELAAGTIDVREAIHRIALSPSFDQRNPGADTFVTVVMEQLAGLQVDRNRRELEIGKKIYDASPGTFLGVTGSTQADIVRIAVASKAFAKHLIDREYQRIVHAAPDGKALAAWSAEFHADPRRFPAIVRAWMLSEAYTARLTRSFEMTNRMFVRAIFVDLLDRVPTEAEEEPLREALDALSDPAPLRGVLVRMLLDSKKGRAGRNETIQDPAEWVALRFRRHLAREARPDELRTFTEGLNSPGGGAAMCLAALLTSQEYARY